MRKLFVLFLNLVIPLQSVADDIHVGAASSLIHALSEIADQFEAKTSHTIKLSFSSSGNLARQIIQGAPFEIFLSADETYVSLIQENQLGSDAGNVYGIGHLVLFIPEGSEVIPSADLSTLISGTINGDLKRLAIANPEYAPYGIIAKQALQNAHAWDVVNPSLVYGKSASQALQFCLTDAVDAALIPYSLVLTPVVSNKGHFTLVNNNLYSPLQQRMVLLKNAGDPAREFYNYILSANAREIFKRNGLGSPNDQYDQLASRRF